MNHTRALMLGVFGLAYLCLTLVGIKRYRGSDQLLSGALKRNVSETTSSLVEVVMFLGLMWLSGLITLLSGGLHAGIADSARLKAKDLEPLSKRDKHLIRVAINKYIWDHKVK